MAMTLLALVLVFVAVARVTRLLVVDKLTEPIRSAVVRRFGEESTITYLAHCQACVSVYVGFAGAPVAVALGGLSWWWVPVVGLVGSQVTIWVSRFDT